MMNAEKIHVDIDMMQTRSASYHTIGLHMHYDMHECHGLRSACIHMVDEWQNEETMLVGWLAW